MAFIRFINSPAGRIVRVVAGLALIAIGIVRGGGWLALAAIGLVPLAAGAFDLCILGPLFKLPFLGSKLRQRIAG